MKTASFTVRASMAQSVTWKRAQESEGFASCGQWLARAADAYLKLRAKAGIPLPLAWRLGRFLVKLEDGTEPELAAGVESRVWEIADLVALLPPTVAAKRGPYKKAAISK